MILLSSSTTGILRTWWVAIAFMASVTGSSGLHRNIAIRYDSYEFFGIFIRHNGDGSYIQIPHRLCSLYYAVFLETTVRGQSSLHRGTFS